MPYFMRYVTRDDNRLSFERIEYGLQKHCSDYHVQVLPDEEAPRAELRYDSELLGIITINRPGDGRWQHGVTYLRERLDQGSDKKSKEVVSLLNEARALIALEVIWGDREAEETMDLLEPLWGLLFARWEGLLQADDDGWHDAFGLVFEIA